MKKIKGKNFEKQVEVFRTTLTWACLKIDRWHETNVEDEK